MASPRKSNKSFRSSSAQVKGRTEQALLELFGEISKTRWTRILYRVSRPLWPILQAIAPGTMITTEELGRAMIHVARAGAPQRVLENRDLRAVGVGGTRL